MGRRQSVACAAIGAASAVALILRWRRRGERAHRTTTSTDQAAVLISEAERLAAAVAECDVLVVTARESALRARADVSEARTDVDKEFDAAATRAESLTRACAVAKADAARADEGAAEATCAKPAAAAAAAAAHSAAEVDEALAALRARAEASEATLRDARARGDDAVAIEAATAARDACAAAIGVAAASAKALHTF